MAGDQVDLDACRDNVNALPAYQRLLGDAMRGDQMLFGRTDQVEAAWRIVEPVLSMHGPVSIYPSGSWGPAEADRLMPGASWRKLA
jgi:glucose-6-phosphate 1-dehydrogenase